MHKYMISSSVSIFASLLSSLKVSENKTQQNMRSKFLPDIHLLHFVTFVITHWENLLDSDWPRDCEFTRNLRANSAIRGKLQISRAKSVIHPECKYEEE